ncbi:fructoseamine 3-kinase family phosophotransferase [Salinisphaera sp. T5B8]|uniref:fructosamine kinase family protein n=1 Tax=Salinisphaera sp. T5B8 TaxID=1304154 RepID=UPI0033411502
MIDWAAIDTAIASTSGRPFVAERRTRLGGGSINIAYRIENAVQAYFVKLNRRECSLMFAAEAAGLAELSQAVGLRVPRVITLGQTDAHAYLVLEHIALDVLTPAAMTRLGEGLADMHGIVAIRYGFDRDNTIGSSMQPNAWHAEWLEFWRENRLAVMLDALAPRHPGLARDGDALLAVLDTLLAGHRPEPSLVHGDLWGGNVGMDEHGAPVLFDPAVYYGDRETDLAMAELFGGFSPLFFEAYWGAWPMSEGYRHVRRPLYQLYHLLNHARLFGGHYVAESRRVMQQLLANA